MTDLAGDCAAGLLDAAPDAMVCTGHDGRLVLVNTRAEEMFGDRRDELVGQPLEILVPEAARARRIAVRVMPVRGAAAGLARAPTRRIRVARR